MNQQNENDNNKNRKYEVIDRRVAQTYAKDSVASSKTALSDPYVKFFRWATDRLGSRDGIVALVSNNSFVGQLAFDGMRSNLLGDFTDIYHIDLHGNVRKNPKLSGTTHNVFGIRVGVGITLAVRKGTADHCGLRHYRVGEDWRREQKLQHLNRLSTTFSVPWVNLNPDPSGLWLIPEHGEELGALIPLGTKTAKSGALNRAETVFKIFSRGVAT